MEMLTPNPSGFYYREPSEREAGRRRLLAAVRGWLRETFPLRWLMMGLVILFLAAASAVGWFLHGRVFDGIGTSSAVAIVAVWPVFLALLHGFGSWAYRRFDFGDFRWRAFIFRDDQAIGDENRELFSDEPGLFERLAEQTHHSSGQSTLAYYTALIVLAWGSWALWELIRVAPTVVAASIIDHRLLPSQPVLARRIASENWFETAFAMTAIQVGSLALLFALLGIASAHVPPAAIVVLAIIQGAILVYMICTRP